MQEDKIALASRNIEAVNRQEFEKLIITGICYYRTTPTGRFHIEISGAGPGIDYINSIVVIPSLELIPLPDLLKVGGNPVREGDVMYNTSSAMEKYYVEGKLRPLDLKNAVGKPLIDLFRLIRKYFEKKHGLISTAYLEELKRELVSLP